MENVTARVPRRSSAAKTPEEKFAARRAAIARIEAESMKKTGLRSDVVTLYQGGEYWLYRYKSYTDVRLVFAPEQQIAFFGGDPDNFTYPRYDLDMALFRVYENGKPLDSTNYLKWNPKGAADGRTGLRLRKSRLHVDGSIPWRSSNICAMWRSEDAGDDRQPHRRAAGLFGEGRRTDA